MIRNLRDTTQKNMEQDWLKTNLAKFSRMLQGQRDSDERRPHACCRSLCPVVAAQQAEFYLLDNKDRTRARRRWPASPRKAENRMGKQIGLGSGRYRPVRDRESARSSSTTCRRILHPHFVRASATRAAYPSSSAADLRRPGEGCSNSRRSQGFNPSHRGAARPAY